MFVLVTDKRVSTTEETRDRIQRQLQLTLDRVGKWIQKASIYIDDVKGSRAGNGNLCRVVIKARGIQTVVVTQTDDSEFFSASRALRRAENVLKRRIRQRRNRKLQMRKRQHESIDDFQLNQG